MTAKGLYHCGTVCRGCWVGTSVRGGAAREGRVSGITVTFEHATALAVLGAELSFIGALFNATAVGGADRVIPALLHPEHKQN